MEIAVTVANSGSPVDLGTIETLVKQGKTVISAEDSAIVELALKAIEIGITATFYLKQAQFSEIIRRNWTPERLNTTNFQPLSLEEIARIKADFNIELDGYSSRETCPRCGSVYGTYEFIQQGIKEHGEEAVRAVFSLKNASVLQVRPRQNIICQSCNLDMLYVVIVIGPHSYLYRDWNHSYGCSE